MSVNADGPVYQIKLDLNGRSYTATRHHNKLRSLVEQLKTRGYRILSPFPEVSHGNTLDAHTAPPRPCRHAPARMCCPVLLII